MEIRFIQTSDPVRYQRIIDDTSRTVALYCYLHSYGYEKFVGLKKGVAPVHATFNRVFMLNELIDSGYAGWVAYIDADAYIRDLTFDVTKYLIENQKHAFIAARVPGHQSKWAINAGVFFINLGDPIGIKIARLYLSRVLSLVPKYFWDDESAGWPPTEYDDQNILYAILGLNSDILDNMKAEDVAFNSGVDCSFIAQALRADHQDFDSRCHYIKAQCNLVINEFVKSTNPYLKIA